MKMLLACGGVLAVLIYASVAAQDAAPAPVGSLSELTAEVRLLRAALEKSAQTQAQLHGLGVYLSAQQSRLIQLSTRVDGLQKELDAAALQSKTLTDRASQIQAQLAGAPNQGEREALENMRNSLPQEVARAAAIENQVRAREAQASAELQTELARWSDLIGRLEQTIRP